MAAGTTNRSKPDVVFQIMLTIIVTMTVMNLCRARPMLENRGYKGITVLISRDVPEDQDLLNKLEKCLTDASKVLFRATRHQVYFEEFIVVLPETWTQSPSYGVINILENSPEQILISNSKNEYGDAPYVRQPEGCGKPGRYMHLTPAYITNNSVSAKWGPRGKTIVHEWGHLRWGLFDEYSTAKGIGSTYRDKQGKKQKARCTDQALFKETVVEVAPNVFVRKAYPEPGFTPVASLMYTHYIPTVVEFCDHPNSSDESLRHNTLSPNKQNQLCNLKSAWEVMSEHSDFKEMKSPLGSFGETRPIQFKYVQVQPQRKVLVLDTSGSMQTDDRLTKMNNAASNMILNLLEPGGSLGIVRFSSGASELSELRTLKTDADRKSLISKLPTVANGGTSIGAGLRLGLQVLHRGMDNPSGGTLIVISDGEENERPYAEDVMPEVLRKSVVVHTISVTEKADPRMGSISTSSGGQSFFDIGNKDSTGMIDSLATIATSGGLTHDPKVPLLLQTEAGSVSSSSPLTGEFYVDPTLGQDTIVSVSFTSPVKVNLTGPGNVRISRDTHPQLYVTDVPGILKIRLSEFVENGTWFYHVLTTRAESQVVVTVQSSTNSDGSDVIQVLSWLPEEHSLAFAPDQKLAIYAEVTRGRSSVLNSQVVAIIERPQSGPTQIELLDNGVGSDITKDDGIYSAYILAKDLSGDGRYGIKVKVEGVEGVTSVVVGGRGGSSGVLEVDTVESIEELVTEELGRFQRVTSGGVFSVSGFPPGVTSVPDLIPPSRITDLTVSNDDIGDGTAELEWTSVGGDMDRGTAAHYTFHFTRDFHLASSAGAMWSEVNQTYLRNLQPPQPAGSRERVNISLDLLDDNDTLFLCVRATDDVGNTGDFSNIVSLTSVRDPDEVTNEGDLDDVTRVEDGGSDTGFYVLVTVLPILAVLLLAVLVTCLLRAVRRRKRQSFHVEKKMETVESEESRVLYVPVSPESTEQV
ncbi:hypothetical protein C0Q70_14752 [Pomacea canaliculata]|uniref:VWFA domain-containing protein n=1 Tax=Pomacea canaliculata TaxID=400727 RepID=A0A2T7NSX5_POMCA|nr:calcium-activated chloride channel regulator 1-like [Pomacea canaliculata]PVD24281.1 hypothetical protein C0Q70_14752 [Pomacea canaliculata]